MDGPRRGFRRLTKVWLSKESLSGPPSEKAIWVGWEGLTLVWLDEAWLNPPGQSYSKSIVLAETASTVRTFHRTFGIILMIEVLNLNYSQKRGIRERATMCPAPITKWNLSREPSFPTQRIGCEKLLVSHYTHL